MKDLEKVLDGGILLSVFSYEELIKKFKGSIYYDCIFPENNDQELLIIDNTLKNILQARSNHPLNDGVGRLYLHEVYEKLGLKFDGDRNIGITAELGDTWHNLYSTWISVADKFPTIKEGDWILGWNKSGYYKLVMLDKNGNIPANLKDDILLWCSIPDPPKH